MKKIKKPTDLNVKKANRNQTPDAEEGYPLYPPSEDIYNNAKEEEDLDPEDPSKTKAPNEVPGEMNEKDFYDALTGDDLDVPGAELDDEMEDAGNEDEENNYYSLGGD